MKRASLTSFLILSMLMIVACSKADVPGTIRLEGNDQKFTKESFQAKDGDELTFIVANKYLQYVEIKGLDLKVTKDKPVKVQVKTPGIYEIDGIVGPGDYIKATLTVE